MIHLQKYCFCIFVFIIFRTQAGPTDSLQRIINSLPDDTNKVNYLIELSVKLSDEQEFVRASESANIALLMSDKLHFKNGLAHALSRLGLMEYFQNNFGEALNYYNRAIKIYREKMDLKGIAGVTNNIGVVYKNLGQYPEAIKYYFEALKIKETIYQKTKLKSDKISIANTYNNIGTIYDEQNDFLPALKNHLLAKNLFAELNYEPGLAICFNNIGNDYEGLHKYSESLENHFQSVKIKEKTGDKKGIATSLNNIGNIYHTMGNYKESMKNNNLALNINNGMGDELSACTSYINLGMNKIMLRQFVLARADFTEGLRLSKKTLNIQGLMAGYSGLSEVNIALGNYKEALAQYKLKIIYRDSLFNSENTKKTVQAQMNYDFDKKEQAAKLDQGKKDAIANEEKVKQKILRNCFIAGFTFVFLIALLILRGYKNKQKANLIITKQKEEVEFAKSIIEKQKFEVETKQKEILDSIYYARRIQRALITNEKYVEKCLNNLIEF